MSKNLKLMALVGTISLAGCMEEAPSSPAGAEISNSPSASYFSLLGSAAGKACVAQFTGDTLSAAEILIAAGYSPSSEIRGIKYYGQPIDGGRRSIGGANMGKVGVGLPTQANYLHRKTCNASINGFSEADGNAFYWAFQAEFRNSPIGSPLSSSGRYTSGTTVITVQYSEGNL